MKISIACGGTGGHMFPGLAMAGVLEERGHRVCIWAAGKGIERTVLDSQSREVVIVRAEGLPSGLSLRAGRAAVGLIRAVAQCRRRMKSARPDVLLAMGSYASVGPAAAARLLGVPVVLHESNVIPGRAIALLSRFASAVAVGFPETREHLRHPRIVCTGFPLRKWAGQPFAPGVLHAHGFKVLVFGGSQGAHALNEIVPEGLSMAHQKGVPLQVVHLSGPTDQASVKARYDRAGVPSVVLEFLREMDQAYAVADLAITRAGAATCAELAAFGVPAILVPLPSFARNRQVLNAQATASSGAAILIEERDLTPAGLASRVESLHRNPEALRAMRTACATRSVPDAAQKLADLVEAVGQGK